MAPHSHPCPPQGPLATLPLPRDTRALVHILALSRQPRGVGMSGPPMLRAPQAWTEEELLVGAHPLELNFQEGSGALGCGAQGRYRGPLSESPLGLGGAD